jgi:excisionase family DNA binding protein
MGNMENNRVWLGTSEASKYLGINLRTLYRLIDQGEFNAYKIGRVIRLKIEDLDGFLEKSRIQPGTLEHLHYDVKPADGDSVAEPV